MNNLSSNVHPEDCNKDILPLHIFETFKSSSSFHLYQLLANFSLKHLYGICENLKKKIQCETRFTGGITN